MAGAGDHRRTATKMNHKMEAAIAALLSCTTTKEAAAQAGIGETTLFRWLQDPEFEAAYREARHASLKRTIARLQAVSTKAVDTLESVMDDPDAPPAVKVSASKIILDQSLKSYELEELGRRVEELERQLEGNQVG